MTVSDTQPNLRARAQDPASAELPRERGDLRPKDPVFTILSAGATVSQEAAATIAQVEKRDAESIKAASNHLPNVAESRYTEEGSGHSAELLQELAERAGESVRYQPLAILANAVPPLAEARGSRTIQAVMTAVEIFRGLMVWASQATTDLLWRNRITTVLTVLVTGAGLTLAVILNSIT